MTQQASIKADVNRLASGIEQQTELGHTEATIVAADRLGMDGRRLARLLPSTDLDAARQRLARKRRAISEEIAAKETTRNVLDNWIQGDG